ASPHEGWPPCASVASGQAKQGPASFGPPDGTPGRPDQPVAEARRNPSQIAPPSRTGQGSADSAGELPVVRPGVPPFAGGLWSNGRIPAMVVPWLDWPGRVRVRVLPGTYKSAPAALRSMRETRRTGGGLHHVFHGDLGHLRQPARLRDDPAPVRRTGPFARPDGSAQPGDR